MPSGIYRCAAVLLACAAVVAGCGSKESSLAKPFAYDSSKSLALESKATPLGGQGVEVRDVSFTGPADIRLDGYLVTPQSTGKHPGVIFAHGSGGDRSELLDEATTMARTGAVTLTLDMAYSPTRLKPLPAGMAGARADARLGRQTVREVRRAVDLLRSLPSVDGDRIAYVGWSAGARVGAIVAGVEHRIDAFDLLAGGAAPVSEQVKLNPREVRAELAKILDETDPLRFVSHSAPSALLFQDGREDELVPRAALETLADAGSEPKEIRWYDSGHVPSSQAWADSRRWLGDRLGLTGG